MTAVRAPEITPRHLYVTRREFLRGLSGLVALLPALAACAPTVTPSPAPTDALSEPGLKVMLPTPSANTDELGAPLTSREAIVSYNDYYEFSTGKEAVARLAEGFTTRPWTVSVGGLVHRPRTFDIEELLAFGMEERIYRMRCVEGWSMVIPWIGFPLSRLLSEVEPLGNARFVRFETLYDPEQMPGQVSLGSYPWPYVEGLRLDEAMHPLTILSVGLYGELLLPQNGAPLRLVVPWKYGFKSIKAIVRIDLTDEMPTSLWMAVGPTEYGFWANVNPAVPHRRWSQATERRIGEGQRRETLLFNGYADEVAELYPRVNDREWFY